MARTYGELLNKDAMAIWIKTFFCLLVGLLIQQQLYDEAEFERRRTATWNALQMLIEK